MATVYSTPASPQFDPDGSDISELLARMGKHWGVILFFGIVSALLGIAIMVWPDITIGVAAVLLGAWLLVSGIFYLVTSFASGEQATADRVMLGIAGALSILLGIFAFRGTFQAVEILALFVGIGWMFRGIFDLVAGISARGQSGRGLAITFGILGILAGLVVLLWPGITLVVLAWISGIWLVVAGIIWIFGAFRLKKIAAELPAG